MMTSGLQKSPENRPQFQAIKLWFLVKLELEDISLPDAMVIFANIPVNMTIPARYLNVPF